MRLIRDYLDGTRLFFQQGRIDSWMVIFKGKPLLGLSTVPKDAQLLTTVIKINSPSIWREAINLSQQSISFVDLPYHISYIYNYSLEEHKILDAYFACMVSEENKKDKRLGSKIKLLGLYQVLYEGYTPKNAAIFSTGKSADTLFKICDERNF